MYETDKRDISKMDFSVTNVNDQNAQVREHARSWWRHQMENFSALLALCEGNPPVTGGFPSQRPVTRSFDVFFDQRLNKQSRRWWFGAPSRSLCRRCNAHILLRFTDSISFNLVPLWPLLLTEIN